MTLEKEGNNLFWVIENEVKQTMKNDRETGDRFRKHEKVWLSRVRVYRKEIKLQSWMEGTQIPNGITVRLRIYHNYNRATVCEEESSSWK